MYNLTEGIKGRKYQKLKEKRKKIETTKNAETQYSKGFQSFNVVNELVK